MRVAIFGRLTKRTEGEAVRSFFEYLRARGIDYTIYEDYAEELVTLPELAPRADWLRPTFDRLNQIDGADFVVCIGGDGTLLDAALFIGRREIPIVAVNAGRLGFLANAPQRQLPDLFDSLAGNAWRLDPRTMLEIETSPPHIFGDRNFALNEITVHKSNTNEMIVVNVFINGEPMNSYWADGLIISTPTGSTAYSLAVGGPILMPTSEVFVITPIAPHSLTVRPIVVPDTHVISLELESRSGQALLALDNRTELVRDTVEIAVRKAPFQTQLVRFPNQSWFRTLRDRLNWGLDARN
jgi:NAD+ kinase